MDRILGKSLSETFHLKLDLASLLQRLSRNRFWRLLRPLHPEQRKIHCLRPAADDSYAASVRSYNLTRNEKTKASSRLRLPGDSKQTVEDSLVIFLGNSLAWSLMPNRTSPLFIAVARIRISPPAGEFLMALI